MALLAILMSVSFTACGDDDEGNNGGNNGATVASIEGTWYLKSEIWYAWQNGQPNMNVVTIQRSYADYYRGKMWNFKKNGENWILGKKSEKDDDFDYETLIKNGNNDYARGGDRLIIKSVSSNRLVVDYYDNYYDIDDDDKEFGVYTFMR